jgi:diguanylate cyclase
VAAAIGHSVRDIDIPARYGADRFCLLLPQTGLHGALQLAERLRSAVADMELMAGRRSLSITASIGAFSPATMNQLRPTSLIEHAEAALRKAKVSGRNRVCEYIAPTLTTS